MHLIFRNFEIINFYSIDNLFVEKMINKVLRHTKRVVIFVIGTTVLIFGIILLFIPGPAIIVIPIGLAILATEFIWAERLLHKAKEKIMPKKNNKETKQ